MGSFHRQPVGGALTALAQPFSTTHRNTPKEPQQNRVSCLLRCDFQTNVGKMVAELWCGKAKSADPETHEEPKDQTIAEHQAIEHVEGDVAKADEPEVRGRGCTFFPRSKTWRAHIKLESGYWVATCRCLIRKARPSLLHASACSPWAVCLRLVFPAQLSENG